MCVACLSLFDYGSEECRGPQWPRQLQASQVSELSIPRWSLHSCENRKAAPSTNSGGAGGETGEPAANQQQHLSLSVPSFFSLFQLSEGQAVSFFFVFCFGSRCYLHNSGSLLFCAFFCVDFPVLGLVPVGAEPWTHCTRLCLTADCCWLCGCVQMNMMWLYSFSLTLMIISRRYPSLNVILRVIPYLKIIRLTTLNVIVLAAVIRVSFNEWEFLIKDNKVVPYRNNVCCY